MSHIRKTGITVPELIGVFALLGVLCAAIVPHLDDFRQATRLSKLRFNLERLRTRIDEYRERHGHPPNCLEKLSENDGEPIAENPLSMAPERHRGRVKIIEVDPPTAEDVTPLGFGGWLYNPKTGRIWADTKSYLGE